jgi:predicted dehydrogenase
MGLNERRKIKELQDETFPGRVKEIQEICGIAIPYEVDWESLSDDAEALNFIDNISCHRLNMALRVICQDEMGKAAVREGLKKIRLKNVKDKAAMQISFRDGVLEMHCAYALRTEGMFSDGDIRQVLEKGL